MSEVSIYNLTALGGAPAVGDLLVCVDISDPTQSPHGTTKNLTAANLFTSPTISNPTLTGAITAHDITADAVVSPDIEGTFLQLSRNTTLVQLTNTAGAGSSGFISFLRNATQVGFLGADASNNLTVVLGDGATVGVTVDRSTGAVSLLADLVFLTVAKGLQFKSGANGRVGSLTLSSGTLTVNNSSVTAKTKIMLNRTSTAGTPGFTSVTYVVGTSFTVTSSSGTDSSTFDYLLYEVN